MEKSRRKVLAEGQPKRQKRRFTWSSTLEGIGFAFLVAVVAVLIRLLTWEDLTSAVARLTLSYYSPVTMLLLAFVVMGGVLLAIRGRFSRRKVRRRRNKRARKRFLLPFRQLVKRMVERKTEKRITAPRSVPVKKRRYETELDALYRRIQQQGKITLEEVKKKFNVSKELAEEWADILESHKLITIRYPAFGQITLTKYHPAYDKEEGEKTEK